MPSSKSSNSPSRRLVLQTLAALPVISIPLVASVRTAVAQTPIATAAGFSFAAVGDTRPMMYLPLKEGQPDLNKFFVEMFGLVMPEKVVEAVKLLPGVHRTMFRLQGGEWVTREIVKDVQSGRAKFVVNSGDAVWWGNQGLTVNDSPYWKRVNDTMLKKLPVPDDEMRAAGLDGRFFMSVGNHEVWADPKIEGVLSAVPYLKKLGVTPDNLIYKFDFKDARFIYLWSGKYDYRSPSQWDADRPKYAEQMTQLQKWLDEAKANGIRKAFVVFHYPVFARSGLGPIPAPDNPHTVIASYAKDMEVVVLNGHVHTTEIYEVDGVKYLMLGGGGAEQDPILPGRTSIKVPADYPPDLYWKGQPPKEEYNYVLVDVEPGQKTKFTLNRFRPWSAEPFGTEELFK